MLKKRRFKKQNVTKVTFVLPSEVEGDSIHLFGDFNDWQPSHAMRRKNDGSWQITVDLAPEKEYQFRYLVDGQIWFNDPQADKYVPNPHGDENSVVIT